MNDMNDKTATSTAFSGLMACERCRTNLPRKNRRVCQQCNYRSSSAAAHRAKRAAVAGSNSKCDGNAKLSYYADDSRVAIPDYTVKGGIEIDTLRHAPDMREERRAEIARRVEVYRRHVEECGYIRWGEANA